MHADHPDREWIDGVVEALGSWLGTRVPAPTSQLVAGGAVVRAEKQLSRLHGDRPALLMPSATYALWVALRALGVRPGDEVLIPQYDWTSSLAVVRELGARPVVVPADPATLTIDPAAAAELRTRRTRAVVATHLFGIPADVPALEVALPGLVIVEDCAQAFGSVLDGRPVGSLGDAAVFSFGPGKRIDVGELGALLLRDDELRERALRHSAHPIRQRIGGISAPALDNLSIRPHPLAAVLLTVALDLDDSRALIDHRQRIAARALAAGLPLIGVDSRRGVASAVIPFGGDSPDDAALPHDITRGHGEVLDIGSLTDGTPTARPLLLLGGAHPLADVGRRTSPSTLLASERG